jgi:hypothetical protein
MSGCLQESCPRYSERSEFNRRLSSWLPEMGDYVTTRRPGCVVKSPRSQLLTVERLLLACAAGMHNLSRPEGPISNSSDIDPFVEPLSLLSTELERLSSEIHAIEAAHSERIEQASVRLRESLQKTIEQEVRQRLDCEFQKGIQIVRAEVEERARAAAENWDAERHSLMTELKRFKGTQSIECVWDQIAKTEATLDELCKRIQITIDDSEVDLTELMRMSTQKSELQAYLKGLRFVTDQLAKPEAARVDVSGSTEPVLCESALSG